MAFVFKKYVLAEFADADPDDDHQTIRSLAVVPSAWIKMGDVSNIVDMKGVRIGVWWPTMKRVSEDLIIKAKAPNKDTWPILSAEFKGHSRSYKKMKDASKSLDTDIEVSASEAERCGRGFRQRHQKRLHSTSSSESEIEEELSAGRPTLPTPPLKKPCRMQVEESLGDLVTIDADALHQFTTPSSAAKPSPVARPSPIGKHPTSSSSPKPSTSSSSPKPSTSSSSPKPSTSSFRPGRTHGNRVANMDAVVQKPQQEVYRVIFSMMENMLEKQDTILDLLVSGQGQQRQEGPRASLPRGFSYPLSSTVEEVDRLETSLGDESIRAAMVNCLAAVGGKSKEEMLRAVLKKMLKASVAMRYNLTGVGKLAKQPFKKLQLHEVVYASVKSKFTDASDGELDKILGRTLQDARDWEGKRRTSITSVQLPEPAAAQDSESSSD